MCPRPLASLLATVVLTTPIPAQPVTQPRTDSLGDPLPPDAVARIGTIRLRHASPVSSLAFSPDGKRISSSTIWFDVAVWDASNGKSLAFRSSRQEKGLFRATVSPDGKLFAGRTDDRKLGVQEALSGKFLHFFSADKEPCEGLAFSRDNHWLASADKEGTSYLWDLRLGKLAHQFQAKMVDDFHDVCHAFTPDGTIFIEARIDGITLWNVQSGKEIRKIESKKERGWPGAAAVSPDGKLLAIHIAYGPVDLWEIATGRHVRRIADQWNDVGAVFSPDGKLIATGTERGEIQFWEVESGKLACTFKTPPEEHPTGIAFSPDGKTLAVGSDDHAVHLWDLQSGKELLPVDNRLGGTPFVRFLQDGKTLLAHCRYETNRRHASINERLSFWDLQANFVREEKLVPKEAHTFDLSSDSRSVVYGMGPHFRPGSPNRPIPNAYLKSSIHLCDVASGKELVKVDEVPCQIRDFTFSPDHRFLFVNAFNAGPNKDDYHHVYALQIWKRKSSTSLEKVADIPMKYFLSGFCVSPDSRWVAVTTEHGCSFFDCETGKRIQFYPEVPGSVVAAMPRGRTLLSRGDARDARGGAPFIWEKATGKTICKLECEPRQTDWVPLAVSPDGRYVAGGLDGEIIVLWDAVTGKQLTKFKGHRGDISSLTFSPDGQFLVSASADTTILIWDWKKKLT